MTLAAELAGAFVGGVAAAFVSLALLGPRFVRWYMKRKLGGILYSTAPFKMRDATPNDFPGETRSTKAYPPAVKIEEAKAAYQRASVREEGAWDVACAAQAAYDELQRVRRAAYAQCVRLDERKS